MRKQIKYFDSRCPDKADKHGYNVFAIFDNDDDYKAAMENIKDPERGITHIKEEDLEFTVDEQIEELESWFVQYDKTVMQNLRHSRMGRKVDLSELDAEAEENAKELKKLRRKRRSS